MLYLLISSNLEALQAHGLGFLRVFTFVTFQATAAILLSFIIVLALGPYTINWLRRQKIGDLATFDQAEIDALMSSKKGTPTMGGLLIIGAITLSTLILADLNNFYVRMALLCLLWLGAVGMADDWLKLTAGRRAGNRQGLRSIEKLLFQIGLAVLLCVFTFYHGRNIPETHTVYFPFFKDLAFDLSVIDQWMAPLGLTGEHMGRVGSLIGFCIIGTAVIVGTSNAVNLTDGLDGLAAGCMAITSASMLILAIIAGTLTLASTLYLPYIHASGQMAVLAGAMVGASLGFLWFNCNPARVFMGDTGSLALGGLVGYIAVVIRQEIMLFIIGGIFVAEAVSVMLQVSYFKYTRRKYGEGRRIFLMSPLHHHFQRKGWTETQVVTRFWLISAMLAAVALATIKLR